VGKTGWIIVLVLLFLLFRDKIGGAVDSITRAPARYPDYFGGPVPGPNYSSSPPTSSHSTITDVINGTINAGLAIYHGIANAPAPAPSPSTPGYTTGDMLDSFDW